VKAGLGLGALALFVVGSVLSGFGSDAQAICGSTFGAVGQSNSNAAGACVAAGIIGSLGQAMIFAGVALLLGWVLLMVRGERTNAPKARVPLLPKAGWYRQPGNDAVEGYWDGSAWTPGRTRPTSS
jgi:hypothetical protein